MSNEDWILIYEEDERHYRTEVNFVLRKYVTSFHNKAFNIDRLYSSFFSDRVRWIVDGDSYLQTEQLAIDLEKAYQDWLFNKAVENAL